MGTLGGEGAVFLGGAGSYPVHLLPVVFEELAKLVLSSLERLENKVETVSTKGVAGSLQCFSFLVSWACHRPVC